MYEVIGFQFWYWVIVVVWLGVGCCSVVGCFGLIVVGSCFLDVVSDSSETGCVAIVGFDHIRTRVNCVVLVVVCIITFFYFLVIIQGLFFFFLQGFPLRVGIALFP